MGDLAIGVPPIVLKVFENPFDGRPTTIGDGDSSFAREAEDKTLECGLGGVEMLVPAVEVHNQFIRQPMQRHGEPVRAWSLHRNRAVSGCDNQFRMVGQTIPDFLDWIHSPT